MKHLVIKKNDLRHNICKIKEVLKDKKDDNGNVVKIIAVVKSNGYGLGIVEYTNFLIDNGINTFAVSTVDEVIELRNNNIKNDIIMLSSTAIYEDVEKLLENKAIITIASKEDIEVVNKIIEEKNILKVRVHFKIDTGFSRYGFNYLEKEKIITVIKNLNPKIEIEGMYSHFSTSFYNDKYTKMQFNRFINVIEVLKMNDINPKMLHICNSSAFLKFPEMHLNAVRIGSAFLGRLSFENSIGLKKTAKFEAKITEIKRIPKNTFVGYSNAYKTKKETKIAIVPVGYMEGINIGVNKDMFRTIDKLRYIARDIKDFFKDKSIKVIVDSNKNRYKCKVIGRIGTHHIILDITNTNVEIGDIVEFDINPKYVDSKIERIYI